MDNVEVVEHHSKASNRIPTWLSVIGWIIIVPYGLYLGLLGLITFAVVFKISLAVGLIMLFTALGFILFAPMYFAFATMGWIDELDKSVSPFEYRVKAILVFIGGIVGSYILTFLTASIVLFIAGLVSAIVK